MGTYLFLKIKGGTYTHPYYRNYNDVSVAKIIIASGIYRLVPGEIDMDTTKNSRIRPRNQRQTREE